MCDSHLFPHRQLLAAIKSAYVHSETSREAYDEFLPFAYSMVELGRVFDEDTRDRVQKFHYVWSTNLLTSAEGKSSSSSSSSSASASSSLPHSVPVLAQKSPMFELVMLVASLGVQYWTKAHGTLHGAAYSLTTDASAVIPEEPPSVAALKTAYQALRRASGVFEELGRQIAAYPDAPSEDVLPLEATPLGAWILTEWARAEAEGMLRMFSEAEGKASHKLIARIAYAEADRYAAIHERITGAYDKDIASYLTMRAALAAASGLYRQAMIQSEAGEHGIACAYINAAMTELETVRSVVGDSSTGSSSSSSSSSSFFSSLSRAVFGDSIPAKYRALLPLISATATTISTAAEVINRENSTIYYEIVPDVDTCERFPPADVAKPEPFAVPPPAFPSIELKADTASSCSLM